MDSGVTHYSSSKRRGIWNVLNEMRVTPWAQAGDACFITVRDNMRLQRTGISVPLVDSLLFAQLWPGR